MRAPNLERGSRSDAHGVGWDPNRPTLDPSEEATDEQLRLALAQGAAEDDAVRYLMNTEAGGGATIAAGDFEIDAALFEVASAPSDDTAGRPVHVAVVIRDAADHRVVPQLGAEATLETADGKRLFEGPLAFVCDPLIHHYGATAAAGSGGPFTLRVRIPPLSLHRHDPTNGDRYEKTVTATIPGLGVHGIAAGDERSRRALAREQGMAVEHALSAMMNGVAVDGQERRSGDYLVAYAVEFAEGFWSLEGGRLAYHTEVDQSTERNAHVEVAVRDAETGRFVPGLDVHVDLYRDGEHVGTRAQPLMWHPWLYHYGENWRIPGSGTYGLVVHVSPGTCTRRDGSAYGAPPEPLTVRFDGVRMRTGVK